MAEPRGFVVVGDTDWWDVGNRGPDILLDSRLRRTVGRSGLPNFDTIMNSRPVFPGATPIYAEAVNESGAINVIFGVTGASQASTIRTQYPGFSSNSWGMRLFNSGNIYNNNAATTSGLGNGVAGDVMGVALRDDSGTLKAQFYKNGAVYGSEVSLSDDAAGYYLAIAHNSSSAFATMRCDGPELQFLPDGAQPWGASARVADRGGYSPGAALIGTANSGVTVDAFKRTGTGTVDFVQAHADSGSSRSSARLYYVEFPVAVDGGGADIYIGMAARDSGTGFSLGAVATQWGFRSNGTKRNNATDTAVSGSSYTAGAYPGALWNPVTGDLWFTLSGVAIEGDPEAGTGASFTGVTGDIIPAFIPGNGGRVRVSTHAREQLYRPAYAEAWDGADLLPEQHFLDRLKRAPSVSRAVSYYPWANQRNRGAAIGNLDLNNADGEFDALSEYDLRDQSIIAYRVRDDGSTVREFTGLVDGVTQPDSRTCRIAVADKTARLDVRVDAPVFALGSPELIPARSRIGSTIAYDIAQSTFVDFRVYDQAAEVTSWVRSDVGDVSGFQRTVNPAGLHSVSEFQLVEAGTEETISNNDFASWSGGVPVNWTKWDDSATGTVTQSGSTAIITAAGGGDTGLYHALAFTSGQTYLVRVKINAATIGMGNAYMTAEASAGSFVSAANGQLVTGSTAISQADTYTFIFTAVDNWNGFSIAAAFGASITVDTVQIWPVTETTSTLDAISYIIRDLGGFAADEYVASFWPAYRAGDIGYWSEDRPTLRAVLDQIAETALVDYYTDADGVVRLAWMSPPEEITLAADGYLGEIAERDMYGELSVADDYAPRLSTVAEYQRNYIQHSSADVTGSVFTADKPWASYVQSERRENKLDVSSVSAGEAGPLHPFYSFANDAPVWPRLFVNDFTDSNTKNDASLTTDGRLIMLHRCYMQRRRFYRFRLSREKFDELSLRPGGVCEVTHRRYGLSAGKNLMCVAVEPQLMAPTVTVTFWG